MASAQAQSTVDDNDITKVVRVEPMLKRDTTSSSSSSSSSSSCVAELSIPESVMQHIRHELIDRSGVVGFPTETVYGLGANALDAVAVARIFRCKGRPPDNPLIVHISDMSMLAMLVHPDHLPTAGSIDRLICDRFWPGPLTLLFPKAEYVV
jgi:tRNA threonylcarbamoyl adenosine modification protein (Sua5/YciO/YrdC/YwlC family)